MSHYIKHISIENVCETMADGLEWLDAYDRNCGNIPFSEMIEEKDNEIFTQEVKEKDFENIVFLSVEDVLNIYKVVFGEVSIRDIVLLDSAITRSKNQILYNGVSIQEAGEKLAEGIVKNHPFYDGNKRTALMSMVVFLELNECHVTKSSLLLAKRVLSMCENEITDTEHCHLQLGVR